GRVGIAGRDAAPIVREVDASVPVVVAPVAAGWIELVLVVGCEAAGIGGVVDEGVAVVVDQVRADRVALVGIQRRVAAGIVGMVGHPVAVVVEAVVALRPRELALVVVAGGDAAGVARRAPVVDGA